MGKYLSFAEGLATSRRRVVTHVLLWVKKSEVEKSIDSTWARMEAVYMW